MTAVIADTDILSTFGKVGRLDLLLSLFHKVYIRLLKRRKMLAIEALAELIDQIEQQDRTRIKAKEQILSD
jgi:hypothetical protein